jgi:hypothetical protein
MRKKDKLYLSFLIGMVKMIKDDKDLNLLKWMIRNEVSY